MPASLLPAALSALLIAQAAAQPERPTEDDAIELSIGVGLGGLSTGIGLYHLMGQHMDEEPPPSLSLLALFGTPVAAAGLTYLLTYDAPPPTSLAQSMNAGIGWLSLGVGLSMLDSPQVQEWPLILAPWAGMGLGALTHHVLDPTSGQVSALNSGGLLGASALSLLWITGDIAPHGPASALLLQGGLLAGGALAWAHPRPRGTVLKADIAGLLGGLGALLLVTRGDSEAKTYQAFVASGGQIAAFLTAYFLLEDDLALWTDASPVQLQLTSGDALFYAPGQRQGGAGLVVSLPW